MPRTWTTPPGSMPPPGTPCMTSGKTVELLACYEPSFRFFAEWWKQLYGESEGKEGKGLFPASVEFTADLHSMGQYIQQGERLMFETVVRFEPKGDASLSRTTRRMWTG